MGPRASGRESRRSGSGESPARSDPPPPLCFNPRRSLAQFTTLENTPADYLFFGEAARQGSGHDNWGLGLSMLHLFTGNKPYEEIMEDVTCGEGLKAELKTVWDNDAEDNFGVIRSLINAEVYDEGDEQDWILADTLYRYLVLFGKPAEKFGGPDATRVWNAVQKGLRADKKQFDKDRTRFSLDSGSNYMIAAAREKLEEVGGMGLLKRLCSWDVEERAGSLDVIQSVMMQPLRSDVDDTSDCVVRDFTVACVV